MRHLSILTLYVFQLSHSSIPDTTLYCRLIGPTPHYGMVRRMVRRAPQTWLFFCTQLGIVLFVHIPQQRAIYFRNRSIEISSPTLANELFVRDNRVFDWCHKTMANLGVYSLFCNGILVFVKCPTLQIKATVDLGVDSGGLNHTPSDLLLPLRPSTRTSCQRTTVNCARRLTCTML